MALISVVAGVMQCPVGYRLWCVRVQPRALRSAGIRTRPRTAGSAIAVSVAFADGKGYTTGSGQPPRENRQRRSVRCHPPDRQRSEHIG